MSVNFAARHEPDRVADFAETDRVEEQLAQLARCGGELRRVFAALAGRLVASRGFESLGYARLRDYARERLGVSARFLQELAQVDARLADLPRLEAAMRCGRLPWSKVRLVARVAAPSDEAWLIARACEVGVRTLERELRVVERGALAGAEPTDEEGGSREPSETVSLCVPLRVAFKWHRTCRAAQQVAGETVSRATVLEWVTAEVLSALPEGVAHAGSEELTLGEDAERAGGKSDEVASVCAPHAMAVDKAPVARLPQFLVGLVAELATIDAFELDARLRRVVRLEQRRDAEIAQVLRAATAPEFEWAGCRRTLEALAREELGMSPRKARALLRIERVGDVCPALRTAFHDGTLSWAQAQQVAQLARPGELDHERLTSWVRWAQTVTLRRLEETVRCAALLPELPEPESVAAAWQAEERQVCAPPTASGEQGIDGAHVRVTAPCEVAQLFSATLCTVRLALEQETGRLAVPADAFEAMLDHAVQSWNMEDPVLRRRARRELAIFERDGWRCTVPGCTSRRNLQRHHIRFRSAGGGEEPENQTTLCAFHHLRGVHDGRVRIVGLAPDALRFELGTRGDRAPLVRYASGDRLVSSPLEARGIAPAAW